MTKLIEYEKSMRQTCIILFGLKASGKSYFGNYLVDRINASFVYLPRMLESKLHAITKNFELEYYILMRAESRVPVMTLLQNEIENVLKSSRLVIVEGLLNQEDVNWFSSQFNVDIVKVLIQNKNENLRFARYMARHGYMEDEARKRLQLSDGLRMRASHFFEDMGIDYIIDNDDDESKYREKIEEFCKKFALV